MPAEEKENEKARQWKVILLGDGATGKTSIANRFAGSGFCQAYKQTIGIDFFLKRLALEDDYHVTMQVWDIGGQSIGSKMLRKYISGAHAVLLCYDMTNYDSFANLEDWYQLVMHAFGSQPLPFVGVIANKCDLSHMRAVSAQAHNRFADENTFYSFIMSAKSGDQVEACFLQIATILGGHGINHAWHKLGGGTPNVMKATIIEHARHDPAIQGGNLPPYRTPKRTGCVVS